MIGMSLALLAQLPTPYIDMFYHREIINKIWVFFNNKEIFFLTVETLFAWRQIIEIEKKSDILIY